LRHNSGLDPTLGETRSAVAEVRRTQRRRQKSLN